MSFPSKAEREKCWTSRDVLWKCLDENRDNPELANACAQFRKLYENSCPSQWVKHFDRKRDYLKFKDRIQKDGLIQNIGDEGSLAVTATGSLHDHEGYQSTTTSTGKCDLLRNRVNNAAASPSQEVGLKSLNASSPSTENKSPSPNARIFRKFQPSTPTFT